MRYLIRLILVLCGIAFGLDLLSDLAVESWWFSSIGYESVYWTQVLTRGLLVGIVGGTTAGAIMINLRTADRQGSKDDYPSAAETRLLLKLGPLLLTLFGVSLLLASVLAWQWEAASALWPAVDGRTPQGLTWLPTFRPWHRILWILGGGLTILAGGRRIGWLVAALMSLSMGFIAAEHWTTVLAALNGTPFSDSDPIFNRNIGFYIFTLPLLELLQFWWLQGSLAAFLTVLLRYLHSGNSLSEGYFAGFTSVQIQHLYRIGSSIMGAIALSFWLGRYELLYSKLGAIFGAGFTDTHVILPALTTLSTSAALLALIFGQRSQLRRKIKARISARSLLLGYGAAAILGLGIIPTAVQLSIVQPNELVREKPYIAQSIRNTRRAFDLDTIDVKPFNPKNQLTADIIKANGPTIRNIRLWDTRPLLASNRQLQRFRPYYEFPDADIDRYTFQTTQSDQIAQGEKTAPAETRQVLIAARELEFRNVDQKAQTWVNQRLIYTHGYGFTLSPVNTAAASGLPEYFVKDIGTQTDQSGLQTVTPDIRASIPLRKPRIYFGEITRNHVLTQTAVPELDYPQGDENAYNTYEGTSGVPINAFWKRGLSAIYLRDWQMLLAQNFTPKIRVLFRREIQARVRAIAPFLQFDQDPYLVAASAPLASGKPSSDLFWIIDAYTVSNHYPYADAGGQPFNYIRNPVKVVVDAYNGSVKFYTIDPKEPILTTWNRIFKHVFLPIETMPEALRRHIRYPIDLFQAQSQSLLNYHMSDPQVFYNREDPWRVPNEIYGNKTQPVQPYYLIMKLPEGTSEEFVLLYPFTPNGRNNLIAWLAARSDGKNYGKRLLYQFPKQELVFGPEQIEALINQDPVISQQISLWNRQGSRVLQGNLLIIPIEESLLYVEPLYLEAETNSVPTLARVIVVYQDQVTMEKNLDQALARIFNVNTKSPASALPTSGSR